MDRRELRETMDQVRQMLPTLGHFDVIGIVDMKPDNKHAQQLGMTSSA